MFAKEIFDYPELEEHPQLCNHLGTVQYINSTVQYSTVQYSTVQYSTVQYNILQYSTVKYSKYSTVSLREFVNYNNVSRRRKE